MSRSAVLSGYDLQFAHIKFASFTTRIPVIYIGNFLNPTDYNAMYDPYRICLAPSLSNFPKFTWPKKVSIRRYLSTIQSQESH